MPLIIYINILLSIIIANFILKFHINRQTSEAKKAYEFRYLVLWLLIFISFMSIHIYQNINSDDEIEIEVLDSNKIEEQL